MALSGPSLPLTLLVLHHRVSRGCPFTESATHEECPLDTARCFEEAGTRAQKSFSGAVSLDTAVLRANVGENIDPLMNFDEQNR